MKVSEHGAKALMKNGNERLPVRAKLDIIDTKYLMVKIFSFINETDWNVTSEKNQYIDFSSRICIQLTSEQNQE